MRRFSYERVLFLIGLFFVASNGVNGFTTVRNSFTTSMGALKTSSSVLFAENDGPLGRFTSPRLDDPGLVLADALLAQVVAPTLQLFTLSSVKAPLPSWAFPLFPGLFETRGSLVAPTLIHGAGLAFCWIAGALAAKAYEQDAFSKNYGKVFFRTLQAGAFATGILIFSTQIDLLIEFKGQYIEWGQSEQTDLRLLQGTVEVINDVTFEAITLIIWRLYRASITTTEQ